MRDKVNHIQTRLEILEQAVQSMSPVNASGCSAGAEVHHAAYEASGIGFPLADRLQLIDSLVAARKARAKYFDYDLFFDPAWSILIDLYRAELAGQQLCVSSVCYGSGVAETTALRYIRILEIRGLVERMPDPRDRRRWFLGLHRKAFEQLDRYFTDVSSRWLGAHPANSGNSRAMPPVRLG